MAKVKWEEIAVAKTGARREIVLSGPAISKRIEEEGLDHSLFTLTELNCLFLTKTTLEEIPPEVSKLTSLLNLVLHSNRIKKLPPEIACLLKVKNLDVSGNVLEELPSEISSLKELYSMNLGSNRLSSLPDLSKNTKLAVLDLSHNNFEVFPDICRAELNHLSELRLKGNSIEVIPSTISVLSSLKTFDISENKLKAVPAQLSDIKLKDINLKANPLSDKRLLKLVAQCKPSQILDYIQHHCQRVATVSADKTTDKEASNTQDGEEASPASENEEPQGDHIYSLIVQRPAEDGHEVKVSQKVADIRPHIVCCIVRGLSFTSHKFSAFIQMQTKLHETLCGKRKLATIATHDLARIANGALTYETRPPDKLVIHPIGRAKEMTGQQLFGQLRKEADDLRKEKKRKVYTGIHKFLYLLEGRAEYPCLVDSSDRVISFPPLTNSSHTKMSADSKDMLLEVTSDSSQGICKKVLDTMLLECLKLGIGAQNGNREELIVEQVRITQDELMKTVYPSKVDLVYAETEKIAVVRDKPHS